MQTHVAFLIAVVIAQLLGTAVRPMLKSIVTLPQCPEGIEHSDWKGLTDRTEGGAWIGFFERVLAVFSACTGQYTIIGGWLAFKVAAKWQAWNNIIKVPNDLKPLTDIQWFKARSELGSWVLTRFLLGTVANATVGIGAWYAGKLIAPFVRCGGN